MLQQAYTITVNFGRWIAKPANNTTGRAGSDVHFKVTSTERNGRDFLYERWRTYKSHPGTVDGRMPNEQSAARKVCFTVASLLMLMNLVARHLAMLKSPLWKSALWACIRSKAALHQTHANDRQLQALLGVLNHTACTHIPNLGMNQSSAPCFLHPVVIIR